MRFQGLPPELHIGSADLSPVKAAANLEASVCVSCKRANINYAICSFNHTICSSCSMPGLTASTAWCPVCRRVVWVNPHSVNIVELYQLTLRCACGLESTLPMIREHLLSDGCTASTENQQGWAGSGSTKPAPLAGGQETAVAIRPNPLSEPSPLALMKMCDSDPIEIAELTEERLIRAANRITLKIPEHDRVENMNEISNIRQDIALLSALIPKLSDVLDLINARAGMIEFRLENDLSSLLQKLNKANRNVRRKLTAAFKVIESRCASSTLAYFWFDYDSLKTRLQQHVSVYSCKQYKVIAGIYFVTYIRIAKRDDCVYFGCFTGPTCEIESQVPWPLHRRIVINLHDKNGAVAMSKHYDSFSNGAYFNGYDTPKRLTGTGWHEYTDEQFLRDRSCIVDGKLCISVQVEPLTEDVVASPESCQASPGENVETSVAATENAAPEPSSI